MSIMQLSLRAKMFGLVGVAGAALLLMLATSTFSGQQVSRQLEDVQQRQLPKLELGPRLETQFEHLRRALQDAVAARDLDALAATRIDEGAILDVLAEARAIVDPAQALALRGAIDGYYAAAVEVSRRLIAGETGEALVEAMSAMQQKQARASDLVKAVGAFDRRVLAQSFAAAAEAQAVAVRVRVVISLVCLIAVILISTRLSRGVLNSVGELAAGFERFGAGDFRQPITGEGADELGQVAARANQMARRLERMAADRDRDAWLKGAQAGLAQELRGELEPDEVAARGIRFLARHLEARAGALYYADGERTLRLLGRYALSGGAVTGPGEPAPSFAFGEGLVGQAALQSEIMVVGDPPPDYLRVRSGLGEGAPRAIVLLPLCHLGSVRGVLELAMFSPWSNQASEGLQSVHETLVIAIEVARARAATRALLAETQRQAQRLVNQEEELRSTNEELQAQQEELRQTNDELAEQAEELEAQRHSLEEKNRELDEVSRGLAQKAAELTTVSAYKSQFLTNMSHELRTPLNSMLLLSNMLAENEAGNLTDKQAEYARTIYAAGRDLLALINQVLDLAKVEAGKQEIRLGPASIRELAERLGRVFAPLAAEKGIALVVDVEAGVPESVVTDRHRLEQVLTNLLANAVKFTAAGEVALRVGRPAAGARFHRDDLRADRAVVFAVSDTGRGIAAEDQERVFAPFEQLDAAPDRRYGGTGLGLSIARELVALLGGELELRSEPGRGSTFTCVLPLEAPASASTSPGIVPSPSPSPSPSSSSSSSPSPSSPSASHLLVIEDDRVFAETFADVIRGQGLEVEIAFDGWTGFRMAKQRRPGGIVLDVSLPDVEGWEIMQALRADPDTADIPVHFVSAADASDRGLAMGAVGYLTKPATRQDLLGVVEALAPRAAPGPGPAAHAGPPYRILVVEAESAARDSLAEQLSDEMVEVVPARTAREAFDLVRRDYFACLILDLSLPDMDGLELLARLREERQARMPPVVVYTGRALSRSEAKLLDGYAEAVVMKEGLSSERLLDEVRLFVRRLKDGVAPRSWSAAAAAAPAPSAPPPTPARPQPVGVRLEGTRLLVVDDDMRTVYALSAMLRAKGAEVLVADTGHEALAQLGARPDVDAVLMDVMMPEMDGYEAMRRIRADPRFAELPIVALTAKAMKGDAERCLQAGASDYLPKPVDSDRLLEILRARVIDDDAGSRPNGRGADEPA